MFAVIAFALMGVLALVAPRRGVDSRPDFSARPDR
ncbi:MAG: hypothetical protein JWN62_133 [Acidimicrobiales bacterium]|nr:hypothetical protein [Acidimicrobiales bacterium]